MTSSPPYTAHGSTTRFCYSAARPSPTRTWSRSAVASAISISLRCRKQGAAFVDGHPEIYIVSNVIVDGKPIGSLGAGEAVWHTDMSYQDDPPMASMLYALEVPAEGGDTSF